MVWILRYTIVETFNSTKQSLDSRVKVYKPETTPMFFVCAILCAKDFDCMGGRIAIEIHDSLVKLASDDNFL